MMIRISSVMLFVGGVILWLSTKIIPFLELILMDWVAVFMMAGGMIILLFVFGVSDIGKQFDTLPAGGALLNSIRRDGLVVPVIGRRVYTGESFLEVPRYGLIEDLGKDTVLTWGRKRVRFALENLNYTPDPRFWNMTRELYRLGFDDNEDLFNVLDIPNMDGVKDKQKKVYYLERMGRIYWEMTHSEPHGVNRLMEMFKKKPEKQIMFGRKKDSKAKQGLQFTPTPVEKKVEQKDKPVEPVKPKSEIDYKELDRIIRKNL
jgi:hypothetical protein